MASKLFVIFTLFALVLQAVLCQNYCDSFQPTGSQPQLPQLPITFRTNVEANMISEGYTIDSIQYYDGPQRKAAMEMKFKNLEVRLIYNYAQNEIYALEKQANEQDAPTRCVAQTLTTATEINMFFGAIPINSTYIVPAAASQVLHFGGNFNQVYNGTEVVRGIPCDVFLSCQYWPETRANFTVKYYFSKANYSMPILAFPIVQVPVRAEVTGVYLKDNKLKNFKTSYEFHHFDPLIDRRSADVFQTPPGVVCVNRKAGKPTPKISQRYAYSEEIIHNEAVLNLRRVHFDYVYKLVRYDVRPPVPDKDTFYTVNPVSIINDYNIGVSYGRNLLLGNCSFMSIGNTSFDEDQNFTESMIQQGLGYSIQMKSPESFLHLDSFYAFTGERTERSIITDVFITNRTDKYGDVEVVSIQETTFLSPFFVMADGYKLERNIPVSQRVNIPEYQDSGRYNYYNFQTDVTSLNAFDLSECYPGNARINFVMTFPYKDLLQPNELKTSVIRFIEQYSYYLLSIELNETVTRFAPPTVVVGGDGNIFVTSSIFLPPPPIALFTKVSEKLLLVGGIEETTVDTPEDCAVFCNDQSKPPCLSFDYCPISKKCYANEEHITDAPTTQSSCMHYSRTAPNYVRTKPVDEIWTLLSNAIALALIKIDVPVFSMSGIKTVTLTARNIRRIYDDDRFGAISTISRYNIIYQNSKFKTIKDRQYSGVSVDECARLCNIERGFPCESFDYCYISGDCRLSRSEATNDDIKPSDGEQCNVFERDPLYHYNKFPYGISVNENDLKITSIKTASDCARLCDNEKSIHCRSFNYCPESNICFLTEYHLGDNSPNFTQPSPCEHYSRSYLKDFTFRGTANISTNHGGLTIKDTSLERCSSSCVTADGFNCKSFDYCAKPSLCLLYDNTIPTAAATVLDTDIAQCDNYLREYFYVTNTNINLGKKDDSKDNSETLAITLSVIFGLASLVGGLLVVIFIFPKLKQ